MNSKSEHLNEVFNQYRTRIFGIAYRMLGIKADAEDIVQESYLRWHKADLEKIKLPEAWLVTVATRLSIDRVRSAAREREAYTGSWLPEPLFGSGASAVTPEDELEFASSLSMAFMMMLERLSPTERAAFLLRDVFDCSYAEIARIVGKTESACRQLIHRARGRIRDDKSRFQATELDRQKLIEKFMAAVQAGDEAALLSLFAEDAQMTTDSGGKVNAARKVIYGRENIARLYFHSGKKFKEMQAEVYVLPINGQMGIVAAISEQPIAAIIFETDDKFIKSVYQVMNPEKLKGFLERRHNNSFCPSLFLKG